MNLHRSLLLLFLGFCAAPSSAAERTVGPISPDLASGLEMRLAKSLGVAIGAPYSRVRAHLLARHWVPARQLAQSPDFPVGYRQYPEVVCGDGMDAVCTAELTRHRHSVLLTLDQGSAHMRVVHVARND